MSIEEPENKPEQLKLPVVHDACPVCGSKKRLGAAYIQELKDAGQLHKDSFPEALMFTIQLLDPAHPPAILAKQMSIRVLFVFWDVCECGMIYCTKFEGKDVPAQVTMQSQPPLSGFKGFPRHAG